MHPLSLYQFEYRLALALALGALLGLERQVHHKAAGTRTHALVALGAALFVLLAEDIPGDASAPGRVAGQIITGIGFLGAGAILRRDSSTVTGLTTAATVWCAGAIGTLAGLGSWYQALVGTGFILLANVLLRPVDTLVNRWGQFQQGQILRNDKNPEPAAATVQVRVALPAGTGQADDMASVLALLLSHQPLDLSLEPAMGGTAPLWVQARLPLAPFQLASLLVTLRAQSGVGQVQSAPLFAPVQPDVDANDE